MVEMHQAMAHGFDTNEVVMHGLMPVTGSRRLNCYIWFCGTKDIIENLWDFDYNTNDTRSS